MSVDAYRDEHALYVLACEYCTIAEQYMINTVPFIAAGLEQQPRFVSFAASASQDAMAHHVQKHSGVYAWHECNVM